MHFTSSLGKLLRNLNKKHWDRRVWEIGYRGPPLPSIPAKRIPMPVTPNAVLHLQKKLQREYTVMQWLATPYLNEEQERPYVEKHGTIIDEWRAKTIDAKHAKMPNKPKIYKGDGKLEKRFANIGNNFHSHRTVEESLQELIRRNRWD